MSAQLVCSALDGSDCSGNLTTCAIQVIGEGKVRFRHFFHAQCHIVAKTDSEEGRCISKLKEVLCDENEVIGVHDWLKIEKLHVFAE